jgi:hypothetical protein
MSFTIEMLKVGELVWARDSSKHWSLATVKETNQNLVTIHYVSFLSTYDEVINFQDNRLRPCTLVRNYSYKCVTGILQLGDVIAGPDAKTTITTIQEEKKRSTMAVWNDSVQHHALQAPDIRVRFCSTNFEQPTMLFSSKWLLSCHSSYFSAMFQSGFADTKADEVDVHFDFSSAAVIEHLSAYVHRGQLPNEATHLMEFYRLCDMLRFDNLLKHMEGQDIYDMLTIDNVITIYDAVQPIVSSHPALQSWAEACIQFTSTNLELIIDRTNTCSLELLTQIKLQHKQISEEKWWRIIKPWAVKQIESMNKPKPGQINELISSLVLLCRLPPLMIISDPLLLQTLTETNDLTSLILSVRAFSEKQK